MKKKISIIIRTKNEEDWIYPCLKSIFKQRYNNFEIIIVDNYSSDQTVNIAKKLGVKKIIKIKKYLPGKALNLGIKNSSGDYIVCISAHCIVKSNDWLDKLISSFDNDSKIVGVYGRQLPLPFTSSDDSRDMIMLFGKESRVQKKDYLFHNANSIIKKSIWKKNKFSNKLSNIEDRAWAKNLISKGYKIFYNSDAEVFHFHGLHQKETTSFRAESVSKVLNKIEKTYKINFPDELNIKLNELAIILLTNNKTLKIDKIKKILKLNNIKKCYLYSKKFKHKIENCENLDRDSNQDYNAPLSVVMKNSLKSYEKKTKNVPRAVIFFTLDYKNYFKNYLKVSIKEFCYNNYSIMFPAFEDKANYWIENNGRAEMIKTRLKEPVDVHKPIYRACYGLGTVIRPSRLRQNKIFDCKIGITKFKNNIYSIRD